MKLNQAKTIADSLCAELYPWTECLYIAGSIRRLKTEVKDIEIVCIPKRNQPPAATVSLFGEGPGVEPKVKPIAVKGFVDTVNQWIKIKGDPAAGKYTQRKIKTGVPGDFINLDLFMCNADNLGLILAIRTGSAEFSKKLMHRCNQWGYQVDEGYMWRQGVIIPVPDEMEFFSLIGMKFIEPKNRT